MKEIRKYNEAALDIDELRTEKVSQLKRKMCRYSGVNYKLIAQVIEEKIYKKE